MHGHLRMYQYSSSHCMYYNHVLQSSTDRVHVLQLNRTQAVESEEFEAY